jgi:site-specific recombinase XerD
MELPGNRRIRLSLASKAKVIANLRSFLKWAYAANVVSSDLSRHLVIPRLPKPLPRDIPSLKEIATLIRTQRQNGNHRAAAVISILFASGLRRQEVADLNVQDVDLHEREVRVVSGKGSRGRTVFMAVWARDVVAEYLRLQPQKNRLFVRDSGHNLTGDDVGKIVKAASADAGLDIAPHALRHAFCLYLLKGGASIRVVNELAGHKKLSVTARYTKLTVSDLQQVVRRSHPRGR